MSGTITSLRDASVGTQTASDYVAKPLADEGKWDLFDRILLVAILATFVLRLHSLFVFEANWDEFLNLSWVYDYARGELPGAMLTVYVHGFGWLSNVSA